MKKIFVTILLFSLLLQVNAGRKFYKIGNYTKVEILKITAKGIQVLHSHGIGYITDEDLSESEKKLLAGEIEECRRLKEIQAANIEKARKNQTQELENLINKLPKMTQKELQTWSKKRVGISFNDKKFPARLNSTFYYADNKAAFQKALKKRIVTLYNEYLQNLSKMLCKKTPDAIDQDCQKLFGIKYSDRNFRSKLKQRLSYATNFDYFFNSVDKSIENYYKAEKRRKEEEKRARIAEKRRKEEEKRARIAEERREKEEKIQKWKKELASKGLSCEDVDIPIGVYITEVGGVHAAQYRALMGIKCDFVYRIYANDQLVAERGSAVGAEFFNIKVKGNSKIRVEMIRREGLNTEYLRDLDCLLRRDIAEYPGKRFTFECQ